MITRLLTLSAALALVALPARAEETVSIEATLVEIVRALHEESPYRSWDALRVAVPRSVNWHLAPPDREGASVVRRSGWVAVDGRQAGVAVCGSVDGPELMTLRRAGGNYQGADPVIELLHAQVQMRQVDHQPTMIGEIDRFELGDQAARLTRELDCPLEGSRGLHPCVTNYTLDIRPHSRSAPTARECRAP
jgi:hypothetical protein